MREPVGLSKSNSPGIATAVETELHIDREIIIFIIIIDCVETELHNS
jgi:hypothetical protein